MPEGTVAVPAWALALVLNPDGPTVLRRTAWQVCEAALLGAVCTHSFDGGLCLHCPAVEPEVDRG